MLSIVTTRLPAKEQSCGRAKVTFPSLDVPLSVQNGLQIPLGIALASVYRMSPTSELDA